LPVESRGSYTILNAFEAEFWSQPVRI